jgi:4-amino-4-deoxy-L-arabinose transferase-like glycosyltransferase
MVFRISKGKLKYKVLFALLALLFFLLYTSTIINKSATYDEPIIIASGNYYLSHYENRINVENPPFLKSLLALPTMFININHPKILPELFFTYNPNLGFKYGKDFLFTNNYDLILFLSRSVNIIITIIFAFFIYVSIDLLLKNSTLALLGFILFLIMPNILANGRLATLDIGVAMLMFASSMLLYKYYLCLKRKWLLYAGVILGLALLSKYTAILLIPILLAQVLILFFVNKERRVRNTFIVLLSLFIISSITICLFYFNSNYKLLLFNRSFNSPLLKGILNNIIINKIPILLPTAYMEGFDIVSFINNAGYSSVFWGKFYSKSVNIWYYYLSLMLVKIPIPILILTIFGSFGIIKKYYKNKLLYFFLIPPFIILTCFSFFTDRQLGIRYILPVFPYIIIATIYGINILISLKAKTGKITCYFLILWIIFASLFTYPNYLTYFNLFIGGPSKGYKYFAGSNLDWGQDLPAVKKWLKKKNNPKVYLIYFGPTNPELYNIEQSNTPEYIIISASSLYALKSNNIFYRFLFDSRPYTVINNSILVYPETFITEYNYKLKRKSGKSFLNK